MSNKTIIIAGSGRSGTTWVQDSLANANSLRTVFEPLHPVGVPASRRFSYKYFSAESDAPELKLFMDMVISGNYSSLWMNYRIRPDRFNFFSVGPSKAVCNLKKLAQHYKKYRLEKSNGNIIKFIRANLMLPWLARQYEVPILFITRHPCAVIASRLNLGGKDWASQQALDRYRSDPNVVKLIKDEFGVEISKPFSTVQALICVWCIENILPIRWRENAGYIITTYERLLSQPESEWGRIIHYLGLSHAPIRSMLEAPSQQVSKQMQGVTFTKSHIGKWRQTLTESQMEEVTSVLDQFSFSGYSVSHDLPLEI
jgi:hypothetical protein